MATLDLGEVILGQDGQGPKVIIPLIAPSTESLRDQARAAAPFADLVEWRVDTYREPHDPDTLATAAIQLREAARCPLIATVRTFAEGGAYQGSDEAYLQLVCRLAGLDAVSLLDVEAARTTAVQCITRATELGTAVIASHHDVQGTPDTDQMVTWLADMEGMGAKVCKLAVMAHSSADTASLLLATARRHETARVPLLTMAMGEPGLVSRVVGHLFGSCATFGALGDLTSAPGQPPVEGLRTVLAELTRLTQLTQPCARP